MRKILLLAEGPTEERFVKIVLNPFLEPKQLFVQPVIVTTKRINSGGEFKGGVPSYEKVRREVLLLLGDSSAMAVTTMFDFYGLPLSFPGRMNPSGETSLEKVCSVEKAWRADIVHSRFRPYLSLHEFEAILFVDPERIAESFSRPELAGELFRIKNQFATPEDINDGVETAPSKRLRGLFARYSKPFYGSLISGKIGLPKIRSECGHFDEWLAWLERL